MRSLSLFDLAFLAPKEPGPLTPQNIPGDDFESYTDGVVLNGRNQGWGGTNGFVINWDSVYNARSNYAALQAYDDMEAYTDGENVAGLTGGSGFSGGYVTA